MARNTNPRSPLKWLRALSGWASAFGGALREQVSRAFTGSAASRVLRSRLQDTKASRRQKMPSLFLMYTEDTGRTGIRNIETALDRRFPGYTLEPKALGRYKGKSEASVIAHIVTRDGEAVRQAAAEICDLNDQESVLYVELLVASHEFVSGSNFEKTPGLRATSGSESAGRLHPHSGRRKRSSSLPRTLWKVERQQ
jgi:hypothetical protein